jgi:hypothetical protein
MPNTIPLRGFLAPYPRSLDAQNPQLIPSMDYPSSSGSGGTLDVLTPAKYLTTFARTDATVTLTITGSITNLDTIALTFTNAIIPAIGVQAAGAYKTAAYTIVTADTTTTIADALESLINLDANLSALGIYATKAGTSNATRLIIRQSGPVGNSTTVTAQITGGATETATFGNAGVMASGAGPIIPTETFHWSYNGTQLNFWYAKPQNVDSGLLAALIAGGAPIL